MPNLCEKHFTQLREKCRAEGLFGGEIDAVATSFRMIVNNAITMHPPLILEPETCVICFFNTKRSDDGRCLCEQDGCGATEPGSVAPFESWIDKATEGVKDYVRSNQ